MILKPVEELMDYPLFSQFIQCARNFTLRQFVVTCFSLKITIGGITLPAALVYIHTYHSDLCLISDDHTWIFFILLVQPGCFASVTLPVSSIIIVVNALWLIRNTGENKVFKQLKVILNCSLMYIQSEPARGSAVVAKKE